MSFAQVRNMSIHRLLLVSLLGFRLAAAQADAGPVAGLRPFERPSGAPIITVFEPSEAWKAQARRGIPEAQPGLDFLKDQGAWYTPFTQPNMPGRYDIRRLHDTDNKKD